MDTKNLEIGEKLSIEILNDNYNKDNLKYSCLLLDIINDDSIVISCPIYKSKYVMIQNDSSLKIEYLGRGDCLNLFYANIVSKEMKDNILSIKAKITSEIEKIQRRKFFRFNCCLDVKYFLKNNIDILEEELGIVEKNEFKNAITRNLSGNGACIITNEEFPVGSVMQMEILGGSASFKFKSKVIRSDQIEGINSIKYETGVFFYDITKVYQDKVIKFIFNEQRQVMSKQ